MIDLKEYGGPSALSRTESDALLLAIQASLPIRRRYQFHIWVQSRLATVIGHDVLICGHHDQARRTLQFECFSMFPIARDAQAGLTDPVAGLMRKVIDAWHRGERMPCGGDDIALRGGELDVALRMTGVRDFVAHGMASAREMRGVESFFCFLNMTDACLPPQIKREAAPLGSRHAFLAELLVPYLHATYWRVIASERPAEAAGADSPPPERLITDREIEILRWVREGKSNQQIGDELEISPLTVKNHIQKILRKLGASNRAQAVARAFDLGLMNDAT